VLAKVECCKREYVERMEIERKVAWYAARLRAEHRSRHRSGTMPPLPFASAPGSAELH
jgi:hypothetical protein